MKFRGDLFGRCAVGGEVGDPAVLGGECATGISTGGGTVSVDSGTREFTFTPTAGQRSAATGFDH
jgi:hypothetical protein